MEIPDKGPAYCECQEDENLVYRHNEDNEDRVKIIYKHWKGGHPPRFPICRKQFIKLCQLHPRSKDLADFFHVGEDALIRWADRNFAEYQYKTMADLICQLGGKFTFALRRFMWDHAEKSPQACIFLAKNYLGLRDQIPEEVQDIAVETINYNLQNGKGIALWNEAKRAKKSQNATKSEECS